MTWIIPKKAGNKRERKSLAKLPTSKHQVESAPRQTSLLRQQTPTTITQDSISNDNIPKQLFKILSADNPSMPIEEETKT